MGLFGKKSNYNPDDELSQWTDDMDDAYGPDLGGDDMGEDGGTTPPPKKKKKGLQKFLIIVVCIVLVWNLIGMITGPSASACRDKVDDFQYACNTLSANALADCLHPTVRMVAKAALFVAGAASDSNPDEWLPGIVSALGSGFSKASSGSGMDMVGVFRNMKLEVKRVGLPGRTRKVRCKMTVGVFTQYINIYMKKSHGEVYIRKIRLAH